MSVTSCTLLKNHGALNEQGQFTYGATYRVKCSVRNQTAQSVLLGAALSTPDPIPSWKASFSLLGDTDPNAFAQTFSAKCVDETNGTTIWEVEVTWGPAENPDDDWTNDQDPTLRPVSIDSDEEQVQEICEEGWNEEDLTGIGRSPDTFGPIENAAGKEPGTPLMKAVRVLVKVFKKNFKDLPGNTALNQIDTLAATYVDKLNNATFYGWAAGKALVRSIKPSEEMIAGGLKYREATIRIACYEKGWSYPMVNRGYEYLDESGNLIMARKADEDGVQQLVSEPINLELDGTPVDDGAIGTVIHWRTSEKVSFTGLGVGA